MDQNRLRDLLLQREKELRRALKKAYRDLKKPVEGYLEVNVKNGSYYYTHIIPENGEKHRSFIKQNDLERARIVQGFRYTRDFSIRAENEIKYIHKLLNYYDGACVEDLYSNLHPGRKVLVDPLMISDDEFAAKWSTQKSDFVNPHEVSNEFYTENNEIVRSKSEKIIADKLKLEGIPYKYEEPAIINGHPFFIDFTILKKSTREEIYWEHFGLVDQSKYFDTMMDKLEIYEKHGIILHKNLIATYESQQHPLSSKQIAGIIETLK